MANISQEQVNGMIREITILRTQVNELLPRLIQLENDKGAVFAQIGSLSAQMAKVASDTADKPKGPKSVLTSNGLKDSRYDDRGKLFDMFKKSLMSQLEHLEHSIYMF